MLGGHDDTFPVEKYSSEYYRVLLRRSGEYTLCRGWKLNMLGAGLAGFTYMDQGRQNMCRLGCIKLQNFIQI